jgi:hypothetical protein
MVLVAPWVNRGATREKFQIALERKRASLREMPLKRRWELFFFRPVETFNTIWLVSHIPVDIAAIRPLTDRL